VKHWVQPAVRPISSSARRFLSARVVVQLSLCLWVAACGGSATPEPRSADHSEPAESSSSKDGDHDSGADEPSDAAESAPADPCADGTCFSCGKSLCLSGWYCDESAKGGAACSWQPECAKSPSCRCLTKVLGEGCSCKDEAGAPHVSCE
jgi:hypothetical protein